MCGVFLGCGPIYQGPSRSAGRRPGGTIGRTTPRAIAPLATHEGLWWWGETLVKHAENHKVTDDGRASRNNQQSESGATKSAWPTLMGNNVVARPRG